MNIKKEINRKLHKIYVIYLNVLRHVLYDIYRLLTNNGDYRAILSSQILVIVVDTQSKT